MSGERTATRSDPCPANPRNLLAKSRCLMWPKMAKLQALKRTYMALQQVMQRLHCPEQRILLIRLRGPHSTSLIGIGTVRVPTFLQDTGHLFWPFGFRALPKWLTAGRIWLYNSLRAHRTVTIVRLHKATASHELKAF